VGSEPEAPTKHGRRDGGRRRRGGQCWAPTVAFGWECLTGLTLETHSPGRCHWVPCLWGSETNIATVAGGLLLSKSSLNTISDITNITEIHVGGLQAQSQTRCRRPFVREAKRFFHSRTIHWLKSAAGGRRVLNSQVIWGPTEPWSWGPFSASSAGAAFVCEPNASLCIQRHAECKHLLLLA
jgi:hypothetical protein